MPTDAVAQGMTYASALTLGLLGNVHCIAMCGGIVSAFSLPAGGGAGAARMSGPLPYNLGRICSYAIAGALAGGFGFAVAGVLGGSGALVLRGAFGLLLIATGLYLAGRTRALALLERFGAPLFRRLGRYVPRLQPADRTWKALLLGSIWGWLPCGLVYAALVGAVTSGSAVRGALLMLCFGIGTLPGLLATGALAGRLRGVLVNRRVRFAAGAVVVVFGLWTLVGAGLGYAHFSHAGHAAPGADDAPQDPHAGHHESH